MKLLSKALLTPINLLLVSLLLPAYAVASPSHQSPNVIIIFADDMGYGDIGAYGHPTIRSPNLDQMAAEGIKWTNFYAASSVCTPSRAGLLTGRLPVRSGMAHDQIRVLFPTSTGGLPTTEITIAKALKEKDYRTALVGKWHLGHLPGFQPLDHGFDEYFGIPYSNDHDLKEELSYIQTITHAKDGDFNVPLMQNRSIIERPANQNTITKRYTQEAVSFIKKNSNQPFFLYLAHSMPHVPLFASDQFRGSSDRGLYGDVIEEIDWSVGQVLSTLSEQGISENTLVVFTSDNGPWLIMGAHGGSAGLLKSGKGTSYEGGMREPAIFWWPEKIKPAVAHNTASTLDLFPTIMSIAGIAMPSDRSYDGYDLSPTMFEQKSNERKNIFYYHGDKIFAVRQGDWKVHFKTVANIYTKEQKILTHTPPQVFNLLVDPSERFDVGAVNPAIIASAAKLIEQHQLSIKPVENQLIKITALPTIK